MPIVRLRMRSEREHSYVLLVSDTIIFNTRELEGFAGDWWI